MIPPFSFVNTESEPDPTGIPCTSPTTSVSKNATASFPSSERPHMWETSKSEARDLQCLVASMMESPYWMGMDQPAKGTILPVLFFVGGGVGVEREREREKIFSGPRVREVKKAVDSDSFSYYYLRCPFFLARLC